MDSGSKPTLSSSARLSVTIANTVSEVLTLTEELHRFFEVWNVPKVVALDIHLCLEEVLMNTISYGYRDHLAHKISITLDLLGDRLEIKVIDDGQPFNPLLAREADTQSSLEHRRLGGLGIHLVRSLMDRMDYRRTGDRNTLRLTKLLH